VQNSQSLGSTTLNPPYPGFVIASVKGSHGNVVFSWDATQPSRFKDTIMLGNPGGNTYAAPAWADMTPIFAAAPFPVDTTHVRHVSIYPDPNPGLDKVYALVKYTTTGRFEEAQFDLSWAGLSSPVRLRPIGIDLSTVGPTGIPSHALYYYDPLTTQGFANWWDSAVGGWVTWKWYETAPGSGVAVPTQLTGVTHRIDAMLSTGELFSTEGDVGRIYDLNGKLGAQFRFTGLSFVGEVYVGGEAQMLFSQALWYNNQLHFNVYSIATNQVGSLQ
jgi:hypothetical protein